MECYKLRIIGQQASTFIALLRDQSAQMVLTKNRTNLFSFFFQDEEINPEEEKRS